MPMLDQLQGAVQAANQKAKIDKFFSPETLQNFTAGQAAVRKQFPDVQWTVDNVVEKGGKVAFRYTATGTAKGTRKKVSWSGTAVGVLVDGKIHVTHIDEDHLGAVLGRGELPTTPQDDMTGDWKGDLFGVPFELKAQQQNGKDVVKGVISALGSSLPVTGTNDPPNVNLQGNSPKGKVSLVATWAGPNTLKGSLNGAGFQNQPVTLNRS